MTVVLGAALDGMRRSDPGRRLFGASASAAAWTVALLPAPILFYLGIMWTSARLSTTR